MINSNYEQKKYCFVFNMFNLCNFVIMIMFNIFKISIDLLCWQSSIIEFFRWISYCYLVSNGFFFVLFVYCYYDDDYDHFVKVNLHSKTRGIVNPRIRPRFELEDEVVVDPPDVEYPWEATLAEPTLKPSRAVFAAKALLIPLLAALASAKLPPVTIPLILSEPAWRVMTIKMLKQVSGVMVPN